MEASYLMTKYTYQQGIRNKGLSKVSYISLLQIKAL